MTHEQNITGLETCSLISREVLAKNQFLSEFLPWVNLMKSYVGLIEPRQSRSDWVREPQSELRRYFGNLVMLPYVVYQCLPLTSAYKWNHSSASANGCHCMGKTHGVTAGKRPHLVKSCPLVYFMLQERRILKETYVEVAQDRFHCCADCTDVVRRQKTPPDSLVFHFPPVDPVTICLLAVSPWWGEVMVTDPLFLLHMSPQQLPRQFFFISQCPQPKLATQLPPVISNKSCRPGSRVPWYPCVGYVINVAFLPLYVPLCVWKIVVGPRGLDGRLAAHCTASKKKPSS